MVVVGADPTIVDCGKDRAGWGPGNDEACINVIVDHNVEANCETLQEC
jgi:hypothetical protein